jgi:hypothetical protein
MSLWRKRGTSDTIAPFARHDGQNTPKLFTMTAMTDNDLSIKSEDLSIKLKEHMTPKFTQLLETCILDGVILGHKRAYKYNDAPSESDINQSIVNEVLNEIHEWFDFDEPKENT